MKRSFTTLQQQDFNSNEKQENAEKDGLSVSQRRAIELVMQGANVFITGQAGSGKSYLIKELQRCVKEAGRVMIISASTGVAASLIGGATLHNVGGFGLGNDKVGALVKKTRLKKSKAKTLCEAHILLIEECSMTTTAYMNKLDKVLRHLRKKPTEPMGGMQIVMVGDFLQNPAIVKPGDVLEFDDAEATTPLFESRLWTRELRVQSVLLTENFRQRGDTEFAALLNRARLARLTEEDEAVLRSRLIKHHQSSVDAKSLVHLYPHKYQVEKANDAALKRLSPLGEQHYSATMLVYNEAGRPVPAYEDQRKKEYAVEPEITLRVGARVMLRHNLDVARGLFNGARGTVLGFKQSLLHPQDKTLYPEVQFDGRGGTLIVEPHKWETRIAGRLVDSMEQIPLLLCYAITIHKAQGSTLPPILVDMKCFGAGQVYVALSRVQRLEDLYLENVSIESVKTDATAVKFYTENGLLPSPPIQATDFS